MNTLGSPFDTSERTEDRSVCSGSPRACVNRRGSGSFPIRNGFTLLELLVVIIIVSLMFSTLFIALENPLLRGDLKLAARMVINEVSRARAEAAYTSRDIALRFNLEENVMYRVELKPPAKEGFENKEEVLLRGKTLPPGVRFVDLVIGAGEKIRFGEADLRVFGNGTMDRTLIHIRDEDNEVLTLTLDPLTGDVGIQDGYVDERRSHLAK